MLSTHLTHLKRAGVTYAGIALPLAIVPGSGVSLTMALGGVGVAAVCYGYFMIVRQVL